MFTHSSLPVHPPIQLAHAGAPEDHSQVNCVSPAATRKTFPPRIIQNKSLSQKSKLRIKFIFARNLLQFGTKLLFSHYHVNHNNRKGIISNFFA